MSMTREEAIVRLQDTRDRMQQTVDFAKRNGMTPPNLSKDIEAYSMAIDALRMQEKKDQQPPVEEIPDSEPDIMADVEAPVDECQAAEESPAPVELTNEVPECEPDRHEENEQEATAYVRPSREGPGAAKTEDVDTNYPQLIHALEGATGNLTGMDAVMTAQIISALWCWTDKSDLQEAKACLDYLIRRHDRA